MTNLIPLLIVLTLSTTAPAAPPAGAQECRQWQDCRQLALDAAAREDYSAFHDLAWRALQAGPKNNPALMTLVARAQSLSGRPHDALVMLQRLAAMGVATDAATSDDFSRVRALPGWAELEARISGIPVTEKSPAPPPPPSSTSGSPATATAPSPKVTPSPATGTATKPREEPKPTAKPEPATVTGAKNEPGKAEASKPDPSVAIPALDAKGKPGARSSGPLIFSAPGLAAVGLGYDAVSGRFIVGDSKDRRLLVVGERSGRLANLAGVDAGFDQVSAFEIDSVEGDLWVVSTSSRSRSSTLHKLQLISGRVLSSIPLSTDEGPGRFTDVAVTPQNILVLDAEGRRVYRVAKKGRSLEMLAQLAAPDCSSLAPAADGVAYAAYDRGILRIDLATRAMTVVDVPEKESLDGLRWIRWHRGSLIAIQGKEGSFRLLRLRLDEAGRRVRTVDVLDGNVALAGPTSATLSGNFVYYLSPSADEQVEVKKLTLK